jgi:hypothetical protein
MTGTSQRPQALQVPRAPEGSTFAAAPIAAEHFRGEQHGNQPWQLTALVLDALLGPGTRRRKPSSPAGRGRFVIALAPWETRQRQPQGRQVRTGAPSDQVLTDSPRR